MERAGGDEEDVVGLHLAVLGGDGGALDQRQQVALYALAADVGAVAALASADLVDLVEEDDAVILDRGDRLLDQLLVVEKLVGFLVDKDVVRIAHGDAPRLGTIAKRFAEHLADVHDADAGARHAGDLELRHAAARVAHFDLDLLVVKLAGAQALAEALARRRACRLADQRIEDTLLSSELRLGGHFLAPLLADKRDADLDEVTHDRIDVAAD